MKKNAKPEPELPVAPDSAAPAAPVKPADPIFDAKAAKSIPAYRHKATARTVAYHQAAGEGVRLFSATGNYIATVSTAAAAEFEPAPAPPPAAPGAPSSAS